MPLGKNIAGEQVVGHEGHVQTHFICARHARWFNPFLIDSSVNVLFLFQLTTHAGDIDDSPLGFP